MKIQEKEISIKAAQDFASGLANLFNDFYEKYQPPYQLSLQPTFDLSKEVIKKLKAGEGIFLHHDLWVVGLIDVTGNDRIIHISKE